MPGQEAVAVIVTGAGGGLGRAVVERFTASGHHVIGVDLAEAPHAHSSVSADVSVEAQWMRVVEAARDTDLPLSALINCAGVSKGWRVPVTDHNDRKKPQQMISPPILILLCSGSS